MLKDFRQFPRVNPSTWPARFGAASRSHRAGQDIKPPLDLYALPWTSSTRLISFVIIAAVVFFFVVKPVSALLGVQTAGREPIPWLPDPSRGAPCVALRSRATVPSVDHSRRAVTHRLP